MTKKIMTPILKIIGRILQVLLLFILVGGIMATIVGAMLGISMIKVAQTAPDVNPNNILLSLNQNSKIYDKDGKLIESVAYDEYREIVKIEDIPNYLQKAFISIEDERFYKHKGVDPISVARAFLSNLSSGGISQGGSTITQQLIKNVYLSDEVAWERKIVEMYLALQVETKIDKDRILEGYLNRVFMGQHAYGVQAASETYFSKPVSELNLKQSAALASIVQAPTSYALFELYRPADVPEGAVVLSDYNLYGEKYVAVANDTILKRVDSTLYKMFELGYISEEEYQEAKNFDLMASVVPSNKLDITYPSHISGLIKKQAIEEIMKSQNLDKKEARNLLYTGGLSIYTTIDWNLQQKIEEAYDNFANLFDSSSGPLLADITLDEFGDIVTSNGNKLYYKKSNILTDDNKLYLPNGWYTISENGDLTVKSARFSMASNRIDVVPYYTINDNNELVTYRIGSIELPSKYAKSNEDGSFTISGEFFNTVQNFYTIEDGRLVLNDSFYTLETQGTVQPQSASVVLDSKTAEVVAIMSKRGKSSDDTIDRATQFTRPPASSFKPLAVYAPALEEGRTLATPIDDTPFMMLDDNAWPKNFDGNYYGVVTTREALFQSLNPPAIKIFNDMGVKTSMKYLERFGIINSENPEEDNFITKEEDLSDNDETLSTALGGLSEGMTVYDMASAYQTFANGGERIESSIITSISSNSLGEIYKNEHKPIKVISEETNWLIGNVLQNIASQDYLGVLSRSDIFTAGKTGTQNDQRDFWFVGYNPYYTAATWVGFDNNAISMTGNSSNASKIWNSYMSKFIEDKDPATFKRPERIITKEVSKLDGLLPSPFTYKDLRGSMAYTEFFKSGTEPTKMSEASVEVKIDTRNNKLAPANAPKNAKVIQNKVFMKRPFSYNPSAFNNILPLDWKYQVPTQYSDLPFVDETKTETRQDGTVVVTTTKVDGTIIIVITQPDGTKITQTTTPDGKVTTKTEKPKVETKKETEKETKKESEKETEREQNNNSSNSSNSPNRTDNNSRNRSN